MSLVPPVGSPGSGSERAVSQVRALLNVLESLTLAVSQGAESLDVQCIQAEIARLQPSFQSLLQAVEQAELADADRQQIRPLQTEAHRRLRLLGVAAMQLRSAKRSERLAKVRSQLQDHLTQLQAFIQGIAAVLEAEREGYDS
ncbi:MAG: hypothetical protein AAFP03_06825 [Cyanobacteria bacterium J06598_3]